MVPHTTRNGKIDFLRFLFSLIIVVRHSSYFMGENWYPFLGGAFSVEFFFLVSGYLMMATIEKRRQECGLMGGISLGRETSQYLWKKISGLCPEIFVSWGLAIVVTIIAEQRSVKSAIGLVIDGIWEILLLYMSGVRNEAINSVMWYLSAMLLCMAVLYPLIRKYPDIMIRIVVPLVTVFILGYLYQNQGTLRNPSKWIGFTYKGNLRAFAEIGLGTISYKVAQKAKNIQLNFKGRLALTIVEWSCYASVLLYMWLWSSSKRDYFFLLVLFIAITLSFSNQSLDQNIYSLKICTILGKYSLAIYLSHFFYATNFHALFPNMNENRMKLVIYMGVSLLSAVFVMIISNYIRNKKSEFLFLIKKNFTKDGVISQNE